MGRMIRSGGPRNALGAVYDTFGAAIASASVFVLGLSLTALASGALVEEKPAVVADKKVDEKNPDKKGDDKKPDKKVDKKKAIADRLEKAKKRLEREKLKQEDDKERQAQAAALPKRPSRIVTPPTLTSSELDGLLKKYLASNDPKVVPAPKTSDVEFVRRIYFDLIGQPPTAAQARSFVQDTAKDKRSRLIDHLLESPEFAGNWARYWRDVVKFHATGQAQARVGYPALEDWLTEKLKKNAPWDEIASGMITATGRNDENGAVGFALAHEGQAVELAGEVSRIFMGIQIQCAQCHDHKTDAWKQTQFHEFAAFFAGGRQRVVEKAAPGKPPVVAIITQGKPKYTFTKVDDPKTQIPVAPKFFLASAASKSESAPKTAGEGTLPLNLDAGLRRQLAASYITGQDNPWFAKAFVNRTWYALIGEAFYTPIDDIGPERDVKAAEVLNVLSSQWQMGGYDIRWLFRTILNTEAYQRRVRSTSSEAGKTAFASNCPSRLRSDQIFGALANALGFPVEAGSNPDLIAARLARRAREQGKTEGEGAKIKNLATTATDGKGSDDKPGEMKAGEMKPEAEKVVRKASAKKVAEASGLASQVAKGARRPGLTPLNLFNNLFGADPSAPNEDVLGTIPQALFMMNSPMINQRTQAKPGLVLGDILKSAPNDRAALGQLYVRVLSRQPTPKEVDACSHYLETVGNRVEAFEDIYWALINSTEFITRR